MFRITTIDCDRYSPMNGVTTVASVAEALAILADAHCEDEGYSVEWELDFIDAMGGRVTLYGDGCEYVVERA